MIACETMVSPQVLLRGLGLPESPRWHLDQIWFTDHYQRRLVAVDLNGAARTVANFPDQPSGLGFLPDGSILVALRKSQRIVQIEPSSLRKTTPPYRMYVDLSNYGGNHLNDMIVDMLGRAYVDYRTVPAKYDANPEPEEDPVDNILLVRADQTTAIVASGLTTPNGLAISADGRTLVVGETRAQRVTAFDVAADGSLSKPRVFANLAGARPDGLCFDSDGAIWVGSPNLGEFRRVVEGGQVLQSIGVQPKFAIACALVGNDRRTLVMMTVASTWERLSRLDSDGFVEFVRVETPGAGIP
jgi:sugar lactone lactonase YvrE